MPIAVWLVGMGRALSLLDLATLKVCNMSFKNSRFQGQSGVFEGGFTCISAKLIDYQKLSSSAGGL
jgi:hypothetical protein